MEAMNARAIDDALKSLTPAERKNVEIKTVPPKGGLPPKDAPLTPSFTKTTAPDGKVVLEVKLPGCIFPVVRNKGELTHVKVLRTDHPIARGWKDTPLKDEYYIKLKYLPDARPVILAEIDGVDYPVGWAFERPDGGRSFGFVCGHFHDCFANDSFRRAAVNGILWSSGLNVPEGGAPCAARPRQRAVCVVPRDEHVVAAGIRLNEAVALLAVEPFHSAGSHI